MAQLLPSIESAAKATELVTVTTFQDIPVVEPPAPEFQQEVLSWARQSWRTLGTIGLALISLLALRSMVRAQRSAGRGRAGGRQRAWTPAVEDGRNRPTTGGRHPSSARTRLLQHDAHNAGPSSRDELSELVEDDPEAAANVLRSWIGQVE